MDKLESSTRRLARPSWAAALHPFTPTLRPSCPRKRASRVARAMSVTALQNPSNPEIGLAHRRIVEQLGSVARHADLAEIEDHGTPRQRQRPGGLLLGQQHGQAFAGLDLAQDLADPLC